MAALPKLLTVRDKATPAAQKPGVVPSPPPVVLKSGAADSASTGRESGTVATGNSFLNESQSAAPSKAAAAISSTLGQDNLRLTAVVRAVLTQAVEAGLLDSADVRRFLTAVGDRLPQLTSREQIGDALRYLGFLTEYQRTRLITNQTFGMRLGNYRILERIGGGTVSAVFLAEHTILKRRVAIKVLSADVSVCEETRERFFNEARMLASIKHSHVVEVYDAGILDHPTDADSSLWYLVLELATGGDVEHYIYDHGALGFSLACEWGREVAEGLQAAHEAGLTHRDLKPSNMLITDSRRLKISDFGLAREWASTSTPNRSELGTLGFSAPEQMENPALVGPPADVYSLGVALFWFLTGELPFSDKCPPAQQARNILTATPGRVKDHVPNIPEQLDTLIARMLSRNPGTRPTAAEAATTLANFADVSPHADVSGKLIRLEGAPDEAALREAIEALENSTRSLRVAGEQAQWAVLTALEATIATKAAEPAGHLKRVSQYVRVLAKHLARQPGWTMYGDARQVEELARVAAIHDLGWLAYPDHFPINESLWTPSDVHEYRKHPVVGEQILDVLAREQGSALPFLRLARLVVRHHHERWQGDGFPDGKQGAAIPRPVRIVSLADYYDSIRRGTPETIGLTHLQAVEAIQQEAGKAFDPEIVELFRRWSKEWEAIYDTIPD